LFFGVADSSDVELISDGADPDKQISKVEAKIDCVEVEIRECKKKIMDLKQLLPGANEEEKRAISKQLDALLDERDILLGRLSEFLCEKNKWIDQKKRAGAWSQACVGFCDVVSLQAPCCKACAGLGSE
jgi:predicted RNase H-like nuclease (RuvC/YqgF family)